jgi:putative endonuclease
VSAFSYSKYPWWRRWFGRKAERTAARFLKSQGYRLLAANTEDKHHRGELDWIARDGETLAIVEVRSTASATLEDIVSTVNREKQRRVTDATVRFLQRYRLLNVNVRFDVLGVRWPTGETPTFLLIKNAFEAVGRFDMFR